jgi:hypothetical protein
MTFTKMAWYSTVLRTPPPITDSYEALFHLILSNALLVYVTRNDPRGSKWVRWLYIGSFIYGCLNVGGASFGMIVKYMQTS